MKKSWTSVLVIVFALALLVFAMESPSEARLRFGQQQNAIVYPAEQPLHADDPFVGAWKLNSAKTNLRDQMKVENLGASKYVFDVGAGPETIVVDGTDQPGYSGTLLSVAPESPHAWKVVRKAQGRTLVSANWTLSEDAKTLTDDFTQFKPDGSLIKIKFVYMKDGAGEGFAGKWVSTRGTLLSDCMIQVRRWEEDGLSFNNSLTGLTKNVKFDGKDYPVQGSSSNPPATASIRRVDNRIVELTDKTGGKISDTQQFTLSPDLKSLTVITRAGSAEPTSFVFDRQ